MAVDSPLTRRFAPSASEPTLCLSCWSRKEEHAPLGACPQPFSTR